jgi:parvulin-like peptidyl-prolyl isomerase
MKLRAEQIIVGTCLALAGCGNSSKPEVPLNSDVFRRSTTAPVVSTAPATQVVRASAAPAAPVTPTTLPAGVTMGLGQFQTVGGVLSEVNGFPIYANKVLRALRNELATKAPQMSEQQFRAFAKVEIERRVSDLQRAELMYGAADRNLEDDDRKLAERLTMFYRTQLITEAGGSVELAREKAAADGVDFDEQVLDQYRRYMTDVFMERKVRPRIKIGADDIRDYYAANLKTEFSTPESITFRLIKVDARKAGSKEAAEKKARELREEAVKADFAEIARTKNDDARLAQSGGKEEAIQRGAYRLEKVEKAMWDLPIGQVSPVIEDTGGYYIAKVDERTPGKVADFHDEQVQRSIRNTLWARQFRELTEQIEKKLRGNFMVYVTDEMVQTAIEMAMQNYPMWAKKP